MSTPLGVMVHVLLLCIWNTKIYVCILQFINLINLYFDLIIWVFSISISFFFLLTGRKLLFWHCAVHGGEIRTNMGREDVNTCRFIKLGPAGMLWCSVYNSPPLCQSIWALFFGVVQHIKKSLCFTHKKVYIDLKQDFFQSKSKVRPCKILVQVIYIFSHPASISKRCVMTLNYFSGQTWRS